MNSLLLAVAVLAVGTYAMRVAGPALRTRVTISPRTEQLMNRAAVTLLIAVAVTSTFFVGQELDGWARPAGVAAGVVAALCRVPLIGVVVIAAATAAGLRLLGVS